MRPEPIDLAGKLAMIPEHWSPRIVARLNDCDLKLARFQGEFVWHAHRDTDEAFLVLEGEMTIHFRDRDVTVRKGQLLVVPRGVEHMTSAATECCALIVERAGTVNTGEAGGDLTARPDRWV